VADNSIIWSPLANSTDSGDSVVSNLVFQLINLLNPERDAKYCNERVCLSVCLLTYLRNHATISHFRACRQAVAQSSSGGNAIWTLCASNLWVA